MDNLTEGEDYMFLPDPTDEEGFMIKIMKGLYIGVIFAFEDIKIREDVDNKRATVDFKYIIVKTPEPSPIIDENAWEEFTSYVLYDIMANSTENTIKLTDEHGNELTDDDSPKHTEQ